MNNAIDLGFISIHYYSIILFIAIILGCKIALKEGKRWNIPEDFMVNLLFWAIVIGIIGARAYFVIFNWDYYGNNLGEILQVWKGGLAIHGGVIAGLLFIIFYAHKYEVHLFRLLDVIVVGLIFAQAIGRWGNFFNGEAHGPAVDLAFLEGLHLPEFIINGMNIDGVYYMPTFLFESVLCLVGFVVLLIFRRKRYTKVGQVTALYLIWYGIVRFIIESFRTDSLMFFGLKAAQCVSVLMVIIGVVIFVYKMRGSRFDNLYNDGENVEDVRF